MGDGHARTTSKVEVPRATSLEAEGSLFHKNGDTYLYLYPYMHMCTHIYIHIYLETEA